MDEEFLTQVDSWLKDASPEMVAGLQAINWQKKIDSLGVQYNLFTGQKELIYDIVVGVVLGVREPEDIPYDLAEELIIDKPVAQKLAADLDVQLFRPLLLEIEKRQIKKVVPQAPGRPNSTLPNPRQMSKPEYYHPEEKKIPVPGARNTNTQSIINKIRAEEKNAVIDPTILALDIEKAIMGAQTEEKPTLPVTSPFTKNDNRPPAPPPLTLDL